MINSTLIFTAVFVASHFVFAAPARAIPFSLEVKPLPMVTTLGSPGSVAFGAEVEATATPRLSLFVDVYHAEKALTDQMLDDARETEGDDESIAARRDMTTVSIGGRFYHSPGPSSWYVGAKIGGGPSEAEWVLGDQRLRDRGFKIGGEAEAGYRWRWDSGLLVRAGFGLGVSSVRSREVTALAETGANFEAAKADIEPRTPNRPTLGTTLNLGLGYTF